MYEDRQGPPLAFTRLHSLVSIVSHRTLWIRHVSEIKELPALAIAKLDTIWLPLFTLTSCTWDSTFPLIIVESVDRDDPSLACFWWRLNVPSENDELKSHSDKLQQVTIILITMDYRPSSRVKRGSYSCLWPSILLAVGYFWLRVFLVCLLIGLSLSRHATFQCDWREISVPCISALICIFVLLVFRYKSLGVHWRVPNTVLVNQSRAFHSKGI